MREGYLDVIAEAWAENPRAVILAIPAAGVIVVGVWVVVVAFLVGFGA